MIPVFANPLQDSAGGKREQPMPLRTPAVGWGLAWRMQSAATLDKRSGHFLDGAVGLRLGSFLVAEPGAA